MAHRNKLCQALDTYKILVSKINVLMFWSSNRKNIEASFPLIILSEKMFTLICANLKAFIKTG